MRMPAIRPQMPWDFAFFASEAAFTLRVYKGRIIVLTCCFLIIHSCDNMVHFRF